MSLKPIAVAGMTLEPTDPTVEAVIAALPPTGTKCKATALIHRDGDTVTVSAITVTSAGATIPDPTTYTKKFISGATKTKAEGVAVLLEGDESEAINATPQIPGSPPTDYPVTFKIRVKTAGQTKASAT